MMSGPMGPYELVDNADYGTHEQALSWLLEHYTGTDPRGHRLHQPGRPGFSGQDGAGPRIPLTVVDRDGPRDPCRLAYRKPSPTASRTP